MSTDPFWMTATIFILVTVLIFVIKPKIFFDSQNKVKSFGVELTEHETPLTVLMFIYGILILTYLLTVYTDTLFDVIHLTR